MPDSIPVMEIAADGILRSCSGHDYAHVVQELNKAIDRKRPANRIYQN